VKSTDAVVGLGNELQVLAGNPRIGAAEGPGVLVAVTVLVAVALAIEVFVAVLEGTLVLVGVSV